MPTQQQNDFLNNLGFTICLRKAAADAKLVTAFDRHRKAKIRENTPLVRLAGDTGSVETLAEQVQAAGNAFIEFVRETVWNKMTEEERSSIALEALAQHLGEQAPLPTLVS